MSDSNFVYIKKRTRQSTNETHGGAWKVAFADFMIALMALFLVLWILQVVDETERHAIVAHLNSSNVFDDNAGNPFDTSQSLSPIDLATNSADLTAQNIQNQSTSFRDGDGDGIEDDALIPGQYDTMEQLEILSHTLKKLIEKQNATNNVKIDITPHGLRMVFQDDFRQNMFMLGGAKLTPFFEDLLLIIAPIFKQISNSMIISGHTDGKQFKRVFSQNTNWELSSKRANVARYTLIGGGMPENRVLQIAGMANRVLLNQEQPLSSENRRIEIFVLTTPTEKIINSLFGKNVEKIPLENSKEQAEQNQPVLRQKINFETQ